MGEMTTVCNAYGTALKELGEQGLRIVGLEANATSSMKSGISENAFPGRYFNVGINESNVVPMVAGFARAGFIPFVNTFTMPLTTRGAGPIQSLIVHDKLNVKLCGVYYGLSGSYDGVNHQAITDMAFVRSIPSVAIISTAGGPEARKAMFAIAEHQGPIYLHLGHVPAPVFYGGDVRFEVRKDIRVRKGSDMAIVTTGILLRNATQTAVVLEAEDVQAAVVGMHTVEPIGQGLILEYAEQTGAIVTVGERSIYGGLDSVAAEVLAKRYPVPMKRVGTVDFAESGDYGQSMERYRYGPESIALRYRIVMGRGQDDETRTGGIRK